MTYRAGHRKPGPGRPGMGERTRFSARVEPRLLELLRASAAAEGRSVNGQLETFLRECLAARGLDVPGPGGERT